MKKRNLFVFAIVLVLAGTAIYQNVSSSDREAMAREHAPKKNHLAPAFALESLDGASYEVGGERAKPLLLNFWASWCGPCELEAPDLQRMHQLYGDKLDLYAVNLTANDHLNNVESFVRHFDLTFPILLDKDGSIGSLYRIRGIPMTFLIDEQGVIRDGFSVLNPEELEKRVRRLLEL